MGIWVQWGPIYNLTQSHGETGEPLGAHGPGSLVRSSVSNEKAYLEQWGNQGPMAKAACDLHTDTQTHRHTDTHFFYCTEISHVPTNVGLQFVCGGCSVLSYCLIIYEWKNSELS